MALRSGRAAPHVYCRLIASDDMNDLGTTLITAVAGGLFGLLASYFGIRWKIRKDLEARYDASLRDLRLKVYVELWALLKPLAAFGSQDYPGRGELDDLAAQLRDWYFARGGLYLSREARGIYFRLQRALRTVVSSTRWEEEDLVRIDDATFEELREIGSRLRTKLTLDVGTRKPFSLESDRSDDPAGPPRDDPNDVNEGALLRAWRARN